MAIMAVTPDGASVPAKASRNAETTPGPAVEPVPEARPHPPETLAGEPSRPDRTVAPAGAVSLAAGGMPVEPAWSKAAEPKSIEAAFSAPREPVTEATAAEATAAELLAGLLAETPEGTGDPAAPPAEGGSPTGQG